MARPNKLLDQILRGGADANISFSGMVQLLKRLGFQERINGSHHIFSRDGVAEILDPVLNDDFHVGESFLVSLSVCGTTGKFGDFSDKRFVSLTPVDAGRMSLIFGSSQ